MPRAFFNLGNDGMILKRFVFKDPYAPVSVLDLVRLSLWKLCLVYAALLALVLAAVLLGNVISAVHHAEVIALRLGEPPVAPLRDLPAAADARITGEDGAASEWRVEAGEGIRRNLPDGRVEAAAEGEADAMTRFEQALRHGPPHARCGRKRPSCHRAKACALVLAQRHHDDRSEVRLRPKP